MRRVPVPICGALIAAGLLGGCGSGGAGSARARYQSAGTPPAAVHTAERRSRTAHPVDRRPRTAHPSPQALVTAETENRLLVVDLRTGRVTRRVGLPAGPQYAAAEPGLAVVSSPAAGVATLLEGRPLRVVKTFRGFATPHITEIAPDRRHAYVTDDARGTLTVIGLGSRRVMSRIFVGVGAHHVTAGPGGRRLWIALGESARTIVTVDGSDPRRPRVTGRLDLGFAAHDLSFSPQGGRVWISSATGPDVAVFRARDHRLLFRVPVGPPPQHIAFDGAYAYLTSGYGSSIEKVAAGTGRVLARARIPYGSFEARRRGRLRRDRVTAGREARDLHSPAGAPPRPQARAGDARPRDLLPVSATAGRPRTGAGPRARRAPASSESAARCCPL